MIAQLQIIQPHRATLDDDVRAVNVCWGKSADAANKSYSFRVEAGQKLLALRKRIEAGEAGEEFKGNWWGWYRGRFVRSRKDAEKVMGLAGKDDPEAAAEEERERAKEGMAAHREKQREAQPKATANVSGKEPTAETEELAEDRTGLIVAVTQNATEKADIASRNFKKDLTADDRAQIVDAIDALMRKWQSVRSKVKGSHDDIIEQCLSLIAAMTKDQRAKFFARYTELSAANNRPPVRPASNGAHKV